MTGGFHLLQELGEGFSEFLFRQLTAIDDQSHDLLFHFFLHGVSAPFRGIAGKWEGKAKAGPPNGVEGLYLPRLRPFPFTVIIPSRVVVGMRWDSA